MKNLKPFLIIVILIFTFIIFSNSNAQIKGRLFAATKNNILWIRSPVDNDIPWIGIGHANNVVGMTALNGYLFAATGDNKLWKRKPVDHNVPWKHIGHANNVVGMAAIE